MNEELLYDFHGEKLTKDQYESVYHTFYVTDPDHERILKLGEETKTEIIKLCKYIDEIPLSKIETEASSEKLKIVSQNFFNQQIVFELLQKDVKFIELMIEICISINDKKLEKQLYNKIIKTMDFLIKKSEQTFH